MKPLKLEMTPTRNRRVNEVLGLTMMVAAALLLLALVSYTPSDPSMNSVGGYISGRPAHNWIGLIGAWVSDLLLQVIGAAALAYPLAMGRLGYCWIRSRGAGSPLAKTIGLVLWTVFAPASLAMLPLHIRWRGALPLEGVTGRLVGDLLITLLNYPGACIVIALAVAVGLYLSTTFTFNTWREWTESRLAFVERWRERRLQKKLDKQNEALEREEAFHSKREEKLAEAEQTIPVQQVGENNSLISSLWARFSMWRRGIKADRNAIDDLPLEENAGGNSVWAKMPRMVLDAEPEPQPEFAPVPEELAGVADAMLEREVALHEPQPKIAQKPALKQAEREPDPAFDWAEEQPSGKAPVAAKKEDTPADDIAFGKRADESLKTVAMVAKSVRGYKLPPSNLLHRSEEHASVREEALREEARVLVEKCGEFGVDGSVTQINPGPVVTTFEFRPDAGVKYSRVTGLADDLCLAMAAESILIERMAGKSTVGIQVPNSERETIWLRDVVESENFALSKSRLAMAMGKDINGRIVTADLASMPHVLIAGSTGSGKSVAINAMIMSVLFKATPEQVRMILVDPKRVELGMYEGIPHLFTPIITEPKLAANALRNAVREMERRLKLLASRHVRNLDQYNKLFENGSLFNDDGEEQEPLPYIMIIIDELADLMMLDKANVEESITRLAQMARAVGIHLVLATQRPSVDVITGLIKANVPTRMSFRLATKVDSRTIIDSNGAESLLGRGDMLFLPPGTSRLQRVHAPFVTEKEISSVVDFWKAQGEAEYVNGFLEGPKDEKAGGRDGEGPAGDDNDELYNDAVRLVFEFGKASTSLLQRRLRIGYGRAAHLIDMMENDGLVGPAEGSKPREILKSPDWIREVDEALR
ncbi:MAG: DNA translocase FtsK [Acidobacteria bacterium]|nr:DNA translocase FtsK [Acidobacteriota bacterium]